MLEFGRTSSIVPNLCDFCLLLVLYHQFLTPCNSTSNFLLVLYKQKDQPLDVSIMLSFTDDGGQLLRCKGGNGFGGGVVKHQGAWQPQNNADGNP